MGKASHPRSSRSGWWVVVITMAALLLITLAVRLHFIPSSSVSPDEGPVVERAKDTAAVTKMPGGGDKASPQRESAPTSAAVQPSPESQLAASGIIRGEVVGHDDAPAPGVTVTLTRVEGAYQELVYEIEQTLSDGAGEFAFEDLQLARYVLRASTQDSFAITSATLEEQKPVQTVLLKLQPSGAIAGFVRNKAGARIAGAVLNPHYSGQHPRSSDYRAMRVKSDENGEFVFEHLPPGRWTFYVRAAGYAPIFTDSFEVGEQSAEIVLGLGGSVSGEVIDAMTRAAVPAVTVWLRSSTEMYQHEFQAITDESGHFRIEGIPEGKHPIIVREEVLVCVGEMTWVTIADGVETSGVEILVARGGSITGRVLDADTKRGIGGVKIRAGTVAFDVDRVSHFRMAETDSSGGYRLDGLVEAPYSIVCLSAEGYRWGLGRHTKRVSVKLGEQTDGVDFALHKGPVVSGMVLDERGYAVPEALVTATPTDRSAAVRTKSREDGSFELVWTSLCEKLYIQAEREGLASEREGPFAVSEAGVQGIVLTIYAGSIAGVVVDTSGSPVANASVRADPAMSEASSWEARRSETDREGHFEVAGLRGGTYDLKVAPPGSRHYGEPTQQVNLPPGGRIAGIMLILDTGQWGALEGIVTIRGEPSAKWSVSVSYRNRELRSVETLTKWDGTYGFTGLAPGEAKVSTSGQFHYGSTQRRSLTESKAVVIEAGEVSRVDFHLPSGDAAIEGVILVGSQPPTWAELTLLSPGAEDDRLVVWDEAEGFYSFDGIAPGSLMLRLRAQLADGSMRSHLAMVEAVSGKVTRQDFIFAGSSSISGRVSGMEEGEPAGFLILRGQVDVRAALDQGEEGLAELLVSFVSGGSIEADHTFRIGGLTPGTYTVYVVVPDEEAEGETEAEALAGERHAISVVEVGEEGETPVRLTVP